MTVVLRPEGLRWFTGSDDPTDLCAHGDYEFRIDGDVCPTANRGATEH